MYKETDEKQVVVNHDKKFNRIFEEYIDKDLSSYASEFTGDYWVALVDIFDILNYEDLDFDSCNVVKTNAIISLLESQDQNLEIKEALGGTTQDFVDSLIEDLNKPPLIHIFLEYFFTFLCSISIMLVVNLIFIIIGMASSGNLVYSQGDVYLRAGDFVIAVISMIIMNPSIDKLRARISNRSNEIISYFFLVCITSFITVLIALLTKLLGVASNAAIIIPLPVYLLIALAFTLSSFFMYKKIFIHK